MIIPDIIHALMMAALCIAAILLLVVFHMAKKKTAAIGMAGFVAGAALAFIVKVVSIWLNLLRN